MIFFDCLLSSALNMLNKEDSAWMAKGVPTVLAAYV